MNTLFNDEDLRLLDKTLRVREKLLDSLMQKGLPEKERDVNAFVNLAESIDRSIFNKSKLKIEDKSNEINEQQKDLLKQMLVELHKGNTHQVNIEVHTSEALEEKLPSYEPKGLKINEGELISGIDTISLKDFKEV